MPLFNQYGFNKQILKSIKELKFDTPTPVQSKVIPQILSSGTDVIATAQTGTGKTAAGRAATFITPAARKGGTAPCIAPAALKGGMETFRGAAAAAAEISRRFAASAAA